MPKRKPNQMLVNSFRNHTFFIVVYSNFRTPFLEDNMLFVLFLATLEKTHGSVVRWFQLLCSTWM